MEEITEEQLGEKMCGEGIHHWHQRPELYFECCRCKSTDYSGQVANGPCGEKDGI
jgi:hypothetical protein